MTSATLVLPCCSPLKSATLLLPATALLQSPDGQQDHDDMPGQPHTGTGGGGGGGLTSCQGVHMECLRCVCMVYVRGVCQVCLASGVCVVCLRCACMVCLRGVRQVWDYRLNPTADIVHSHDFNRYLSPFKAEWDPKDLTESTVVVGR